MTPTEQIMTPKELQFMKYNNPDTRSFTKVFSHRNSIQNNDMTPKEQTPSEEPFLLPEKLKRLPRELT